MIRNATDVIRAAAVCLLLLLAVAADAEVYSHSEAQMDWPLAIGSSVSWVPGSRVSFSGASAWNDVDGDFAEDEQSGWVDTTASRSVDGASSEARTLAWELFEEVTASLSPPGYSETFADALARREARFTANSAGTVSFSSAFLLLQEMYTTQPGEVADGASVVYLQLINETRGQLVVDSRTLDNQVADGEGFIDTVVGTVIVSLEFAPGDEGIIRAEVFNLAGAAPEPGSLALLACGALAMLKRRRR